MALVLPPGARPSSTRHQSVRAGGQSGGMSASVVSYFPTFQRAFHASADAVGSSDGGAMAACFSESADVKERARETEEVNNNEAKPRLQKL